MIYLDNSSTTRAYDAVIERMADVERAAFGNPSSLHTMGVAAAELVENARRALAAHFPADGRIVFTSGGTESDNMALRSAARKLRRSGRKIITSRIEHPAVLETCRQLEADGYSCVRIGVDADGVFDLAALESALDDNTILVSLMSVNNETGTIEPVLAAYDCVARYRKAHHQEILFHTDAVQAFAKLDLRAAPFDLISISGHKFHGPKGVGALYVRQGLQLPPFLTGGGQEQGWRSSTENVPGIVGMGLAAELAAERSEGNREHLRTLSTRLYDGLKAGIPDIRLNGPGDIGFSLHDAGKRCPAVLNLSFLGTRGEVLLHTLEQDGIYVSTGSACSSHKTGDSSVLQAMGRTHKEIEGAIRFSFSEENTREDMATVIASTRAAVERFRSLGSFH